jgi:hypothetical protein
MAKWCAAPLIRPAPSRRYTWSPPGAANSTSCWPRSPRYRLAAGASSVARIGRCRKDGPHPRTPQQDHDRDRLLPAQRPPVCRALRQCSPFPLGRGESATLVSRCRHERGSPETAWATALTILPSCATWRSTSCARTTPRPPCGESSNSPAGKTATLPTSSLNSEMRLPCGEIVSGRDLHWR